MLFNSPTYVNWFKKTNILSPAEREEKNLEENQQKKLQESMSELLRRIDITRRARFACSTRLRIYFNKIQNLIVFYNILVVIISITTLYQFYNNSAEWSTYLTLSISIALSFFATHMGGKNYKEKAIMMESNGHHLSKLYGKIEMMKVKSKIDTDKVADLYKEYERTLVIVENHEQIDYLQAKKVKRTATLDEEKKLDKYYKKERRVFYLAYIIPLILGLTILVTPFFL